MPWRASAWARKEALLKARGTGLRVDPASVEAFAVSCRRDRRRRPGHGCLGPARRVRRSAGRRGNGPAAKLGVKPMLARDV